MTKASRSFTFVLALTVAELLFAPVAHPASTFFTDSQGRTTLFRYSLKPEWDPNTPRGVLIYVHGNNALTQQQVIDAFFPSVEQAAFQRGLIPVAISSPETRPPPNQTVRQWYEEDELLLHELLQSHFGGRLTVDFNRVFFSGASQGTCFIHDFLPAYGENYQGGFYGGCGCYNTPDPLWNPSTEFRQNFKVFVHATLGDFLYEPSQEGYGYYRYTLGMETRGDLDRPGTHCSAVGAVEQIALDWLTGESELPEDDFHLHWERVFVGDRLRAVAVGFDGTVYLYQLNEQFTASSLYELPYGAADWNLTATQSDWFPNDLDIAGGFIFATEGNVLWRAPIGTTQFEFVDTEGTSSSLLTDLAGNLYWGRDFIYKSDDFGASWSSIGSLTDVPGAPENARFLNQGSLITSDPRLLTGLTGSSDTRGISPSSGFDWSQISAPPGAVDVQMAWDGQQLWALVYNGTSFLGSQQLFVSSDEGFTWVERELPDSFDEYYCFRCGIFAPRDQTLIIYGNLNATWITRDGGDSWVRAYAGRTFGNNLKFAVDPLMGTVYATDGGSLFRLVDTEVAIDADLDRVRDVLDNCPGVPNPLQQNSDNADDGGDSCDAFPARAEVSVDEDSDGLPDEWNSFCGLTCQIASGLTLDPDPTEHFDLDRDGFSNEEEIEAGTDPQDPDSIPLNNGINMILIRAAQQRES